MPELDTRNLSLFRTGRDQYWTKEQRHPGCAKIEHQEPFLQTMNIHTHPVLNYLNTHNIIFKPRPTCPHKKTEIVQHKVPTVKAIISGLGDEKTSASKDTVVALVAFLSNIFSGNCILSSFKLAKGYNPSVVGFPNTMVSQELGDAHHKQAAIRDLIHLNRSRSPHLTPAHFFNPETICASIIILQSKTRNNNE